MLHCHKVSYILLLHCQVMLNGSGYIGQSNSLIQKGKTKWNSTKSTSQNYLM